MGGLRHMTGYPDRPPVRAGISLGDSLAGIFGVVGALMALHNVGNTGKGQFVDVALYEAVFGVMESMLPEYSAVSPRDRTGAAAAGDRAVEHVSVQGRQLRRDRGNGDDLQAAHAGDRPPDLANDPSLAATRAVRDRNVWTRRSAHGRPSGMSRRCSRRFAKAEVPSGRIYSVADISNDPHFRARGMIEPAPSRRSRSLARNRAETRSATPGTKRWIGPKLGEHVEEVLASVGITGEALRAAARGRDYLSGRIFIR